VIRFLFVVKVAALKQQIANFYPQIQRTQASYQIYVSQKPVISGVFTTGLLGPCPLPLNCENRIWPKMQS